MPEEVAKQVKKTPGSRVERDRRVEEKRRATKDRVPTIWFSKEQGEILDTIVSEGGSTKKDVLALGLAVIDNLLKEDDKRTLNDIQEAISNGEQVTFGAK